METTADQARNRLGLDSLCSCAELNMDASSALHRSCRDLHTWSIMTGLHFIVFVLQASLRYEVSERIIKYRQNVDGIFGKIVQKIILQFPLFFFFFFPDSPDLMSYPDTAAPTPEWNRTSASSARRSLRAAITCRNTSKSTGFHEAAGQDALQTDPCDPALTDWRWRRGWGRCAWRKRDKGIGWWHHSPNTLKRTPCRALLLACVHTLEYVTHIHGTVIIYWVTRKDWKT